jgi:hypothetical protein
MVKKPTKPSKQHYAPSQMAMRRMQDALHEYDRAATAMEAKWGVDRLPWLVEQGLRGRFEAQMDLLNKAIEDQHDVEHQVSVTLRGLAALEQAAIAAGHKPLTGEYWEAAMDDGKVLAITRSNYEAGKVAKENREMVVYSIDEIAAIVSGWRKDKAGQVAEMAKEMFPGAAVEKVRTRTEKELNDEIPF